MLFTHTSQTTRHMTCDPGGCYIMLLLIWMAAHPLLTMLNCIYNCIKTVFMFLRLTGWNMNMTNSRKRVASKQFRLKRREIRCGLFIGYSFFWSSLRFYINYGQNAVCFKTNATYQTHNLGITLHHPSRSAHDFLSIKVISNYWNQLLNM